MLAMRKNEALFKPSNRKNGYWSWTFYTTSLTYAFFESYKVSERRTLGFIFSHGVQIIRMKFEVVLKQFKLNILIQIYRAVFNKGK